MSVGETGKSFTY